MMVAGRPVRIVECSSPNGYLLPVAKAKLAQLWERFDAFNGAAPLKQIGAGPQGESIEVSIVAGIGRIRIHGGAAAGAAFYWIPTSGFRALTKGAQTVNCHIVTVYDFDHRVVQEFFAPFLLPVENTFQGFMSADASTAVFSRISQASGNNTQILTVSRWVAQETTNPDGAVTTTMVQVRNDLDLGLPAGGAKSFIGVNRDGTRILFQQFDSNFAPLTNRLGVLDVAYDQAGIATFTERTVANNDLFGGSGTGPYSSIALVSIDPSFRYVYGWGLPPEHFEPQGIFASWDTGFDVFRIDMNDASRVTLLEAGSLQGFMITTSPPGGASATANYGFTGVDITPAPDGSAWIELTKAASLSLPGGNGTKAFSLMLYHNSELVRELSNTYSVVGATPNLNSLRMGSLFLSHFGVGQGLLSFSSFSPQAFPFNVSEDGAKYFSWYGAYLADSFSNAFVSWNNFEAIGNAGIEGTMPTDHALDPINLQVRPAGEQLHYDAYFGNNALLSFLWYNVQQINGVRSIVDVLLPTTVSVKLDDVVVGTAQLGAAAWQNFTFTFQSGTEVGTIKIPVPNSDPPLEIEVPIYESHRLSFETDGLPFLLDAVAFNPDPALSPPAIFNGEFTLPTTSGYGTNGLSSWGKWAVTALSDAYLTIINARTADQGVVGYGPKFSQAVSLPSGNVTLTFKARAHPNFPPFMLGGPWQSNVACMYGTRIEKHVEISNRNRFLWYTPYAQAGGNSTRFHIFEIVENSGRLEWRLIDVSDPMPLGAGQSFLTNFFDTQIYR